MSSATYVVIIRKIHHDVCESIYQKLPEFLSHISTPSLWISMNFGRKKICCVEKEWSVLSKSKTHIFEPKASMTSTRRIHKEFYLDSKSSTIDFHRGLSIVCSCKGSRGLNRMLFYLYPLIVVYATRNQCKMICKFKSCLLSFLLYTYYFFLNQTPVFEWYVFSCGSKNGYQKDMW